MTLAGHLPILGRRPEFQSGSSMAQTAAAAKQAARYWVVGGVYKDTRFDAVRPNFKQFGLGVQIQM